MQKTKTPKLTNATKQPSEFDRAPGQEYQDRNVIKCAEETRDIPTMHGAIK
jgi:hypothetical protein